MAKIRLALSASQKYRFFSAITFSYSIMKSHYNLSFKMKNLIREKCVVKIINQILKLEVAERIYLISEEDVDESLNRWVLGVVEKDLGSVLETFLLIFGREFRRQIPRYNKELFAEIILRSVFNIIIEKF